MTTPFYLFDATRTALTSAVQDEKDRLARGEWKTEADARKHVGRIKGLEQAMALLRREYDKIEHLDEEEHDE